MDRLRRAIKSSGELGKNVGKTAARGFGGNVRQMRGALSGRCKDYVRVVIMFAYDEAVLVTSMYEK